MDQNVTREREQAHALLDLLPVEKLAAVRSLLAVMVEPLSTALASSPAEDEDVTAETAAAIDRGRASLARGEAIPHEDVRREFGLGK
jgi:predicted transcriptional regulator